MKVKEILVEVPLPDDWDKEVYKPNVSFAKQLRYATERAQKIGTGSSRVAFIIEYQGRPTVLKIAKNQKGIAQNDFESQMFDDYYFSDLGISIPMIDYDEENEYPRWIHTEKAEKMKPNQFKKFFGVSHNDVVAMVEHGAGQSRLNPDYNKEVLSAYEEIINDEDHPSHDFVSALINIVGNYTNIAPGDFGRLANWGVYQGRPAIIDIGHSQDVMTKYYS